MNKISKLIFQFALFLIILSVAGMEIPEISKLLDDVSNDGEVAQIQCEVKPPVKSTYDGVKLATLTQDKCVVFCEAFGSLAPCVPRKRSADPLALLTSLRL
jgi:hypothetical protein